MNKYLDFLNERLGIPDGNIQGAEKIYDLVLDNLNEMGDSIIESDETYLGTVDIKIGNIDFNNIKLVLKVNYTNNSFLLTGMAVNIDPTGMSNIKILYDKNKVNDTTISFRYNIIEGKTSYKDIHTHFLNKKNMMVGSISHELKHIYDKYMIGHEFFGNIIPYSVFANTNFGINSIDKFIYKLYLVTKIENLVRSSEIGGEIKSLNISKSEFLGFLKNNDLYKNLKECSNFSFSKMKSDLYNEVDMIRLRLKESGMNTPPSDDDSLVDLILELTFRNINAMSFSKLKDVLGLNNPFNLLFMDDNVIDYFNKYLKKNNFKNKEKYFEYCEKMINFEANKVLKKISKLYDMCEDNEVNKLQSNITDKNKNSNECIINHEAHLNNLPITKIVFDYDSFIKEEKNKVVKKKK